MGSKNIILIGFMGSGKTSVGKMISRLTGMKYIDLDRMIVKKSSMSIPAIFKKYGEERFREIESSIVKKTCAMKGAVISTGGGVVKRPGNTRLLRKAGTVVYLQSAFNVIVKRIKARDDRPLFNMKDLKGTKKLYAGRLPVYKKAAHVTVKTGGKTVEKTALEVLKKVKEGA